MKYFISFFFTVFLSWGLFAQAGYRIDFTIKNYDRDTALLAYKYGNQQFVSDTLTAQTPGHFVFEGTDTIPYGMYLLVLQPKNRILEFIIDRGDQHFSVFADAKDLSQPATYLHSSSNAIFQEYVRFMMGLRQKAALIRQEILIQDSLKNTQRKNELILAYEQLNQQVEQYQDKFIHENAGTFPALVVQSIREVKVPEFSGSPETVLKKRYDYYRYHYFDNIDFSDERLLYTNFYSQKVLDYVNKIIPQVPDTLIYELDNLLQKLEAAPKIHRYFLVTFLTQYGNSHEVGFDAIFVHLVNKYVKTGILQDIDEDKKAILLRNADLLEPVLIGKIAPNITLYEEDGSAHSIYDVDKDYTVLYFWGPECGYCKRAAPDLVKFYKAFKDRVAVITICNQLGKDSYKCWDSVKEHEFNDMINLADPDNHSHFQTKFFVRMTPTIYILDKEKRIITKGILTKDLKEVMKRILNE